jgi:hypothetical protein
VGKNSVVLPCKLLTIAAFRFTLVCKGLTATAAFAIKQASATIVLNFYIWKRAFLKPFLALTLRGGGNDLRQDIKRRTLCCDLLKARLTSRFGKVTY